VKIAVVSSRFPYPLLKGDKLRLYYQIKYLNQYHKLCLISIVENMPSQSELDHMRTMVDHLHIIHIPRWKRIRSTMVSLFSNLPMQVAYFCTRSSIKEVADILSQYQPDRIYSQLIRTAPYVHGLNDTPKTIDYMDAFSLGAKRRGKEVLNPLERLFWKSEYRRLRNYEKTVYHQFDHHTIISERDRAHIFGDQDRPVDIITNGIEVAPPVDLISKWDIGFLGNLGYFPNQKAADYLMERIIPQLREKYPDLTVLIGGINPTPKIKSYASKHVKITGYIDRMADAYRDVKIMVAPIFQGSGLQNKLLEAMAARAACVTTSNVNASLRAIPDTHLLIADEEAAFCNAIELLLRDRNHRKQLVDAAYLFVKERYDWNVSNQKLNTILLREKADQ